MMQFSNPQTIQEAISEMQIAQNLLIGCHSSEADEFPFVVGMTATPDFALSLVGWPSWNGSSRLICGSPA